MGYPPQLTMPNSLGCQWILCRKMVRMLAPLGVWGLNKSDLTFKKDTKDNMFCPALFNRLFGFCRSGVQITYIKLPEFTLIKK